jgi:nicotinamidase/pyrazinamidase
VTDATRTALVVVDMQNAFVADGAPLRVAGADGVVGAVNAWVGTASGYRWPVLYTRDIEPTEIPAGDPQRLTDLCDGLDVRGTVVDKGPGRLGGFSGFVLTRPHDGGGGPGAGGLSDLATLLHDDHIDHVVVVGLVACVCVAATARDVRRLGYAGTLPLQATASVHAHPDSDDAALAELTDAGVAAEANTRGVGRTAAGLFAEAADGHPVACLPPYLRDEHAEAG